MLFHLWLFLFFLSSRYHLARETITSKNILSAQFFLFNVSLIFFDFIGTIWTYQTTIAPIK